MKYFFTLFPVLFFSQLDAQNRKTYVRDSTRINDLTKRIIEMSLRPADSSRNRARLPFENFIVKDSRYDTSYVAVGVVKLLLGRTGESYKRRCFFRS